MDVSLSNSVKNNTLWNTLQRIKTQSLAATLANTTAVTINLRKWAHEVSYYPQTVYTNLIQIPSSHRLVTLPYNVLGGNNVTCEENQHINLSIDIFDPVDVTFAIIVMRVKDLELVPIKLTNHVVYAYLHRFSTDDEWKVVICDPNYDKRTSRQDQIKLYKLGQYILAKVSFSWSSDSIQRVKELIELHRCINVNRCVPNVGNGICFTGICATLLATAKYCESNRIKAHNGNELMNLILQASAVGRSVAPSLVSRMHLGRGARGLSQIMRKKTTRSISPFNQASSSPRTHSAGTTPTAATTPASSSSNSDVSSSSSPPSSSESSSSVSPPLTSHTRSSRLSQIHTRLIGPRRRHALSPPRASSSREQTTHHAHHLLQPG